MDLGADMLAVVKFLAFTFVTVEALFTVARVLNRGVRESS